MLFLMFYIFLLSLIYIAMMEVCLSWPSFEDQPTAPSSSFVLADGWFPCPWSLGPTPPPGVLDWWSFSSGFEPLGERESPGSCPVAAVQEPLALLSSSAAWRRSVLAEGGRKRFTGGGRQCWGLVLNCYESITRQHKTLNVKVLRPSKHYFP